MAADRIHRQRLDLLAAAPLGEGADLDAAQHPGAVVDEPVLVQIALLRRVAIRSADGHQQRPVARPHPRCDAHDITRTLALEHQDAAAIDGPHVRQGIDAQPMSETLSDDHEVDRLATEHDAAGDVDVVGTQQAADHEVLAHPTVEAEHIQRAVDILVCAHDERTRRVGRVDPDRRIVGVVAHGRGHHPGLDHAGGGGSTRRRGRPLGAHGERDAEDRGLELCDETHALEVIASAVHPRIRCSRTARTRRRGSACRSNGCPWSW